MPRGRHLEVGNGRREGGDKVGREDAGSSVTLALPRTPWGAGLDWAGLDWAGLDWAVVRAITSGTCTTYYVLRKLTEMHATELAL